MSSTRIRRHINAPRATVYQALIDPRAIAQWKVPAGMSCQVHSFEPRSNGKGEMTKRESIAFAVRLSAWVYFWA